MLKIFNSFFSILIPIIPKRAIWLIAKRYVAGTNVNKALEITSKLNNKGYKVTLDILGEHTKEQSLANDITNQYCDIINEISNKNLECNISVKPTHIGLDICQDTFQKNIEKLLDKSIESNVFLRLDMENSKVTSKTIKTVNKYYKKTDTIGTVVQAYLHRSLNDIENMDNGMNFRICKGIYKEDPSIAIQDRISINENFINILREIFKRNGYAAIATHDTSLIENCYKLIDELEIDSNQFEFQSLYGVPMNGYLQKHLDKGYKVRIYVPYGLDWYKYSIRRLKENPNIIGYVIKNFFNK